MTALKAPAAPQVQVVAHMFAWHAYGFRVTGRDAVIKERFHMKTGTPIETFINELNDAFERGDVAFIVDRCTDDVRWAMVGEELVVGKEALRAAMAQTEDGPLPSITIDRLIIDGENVACVGSMTMGAGDDEQEYGFCDVYRLTGGDELRIREVTAFVIQTSGAQAGA